ncbi:MAG: AAA family ATPase [Sphingomonas sp.]
MPRNVLGNAAVVPIEPVARPLPVERFLNIGLKLDGMWLIKGLLPATGLALIYGHPGSGKSFLALDLALHVALGWEWNGKRTKQGLVIYVGAEGSFGLRNRIVAFRNHHELTDCDTPFSLVPTPVNLQSPDADIDRLRDLIRAEMAHFGVAPALIVVDTISKTFGDGKENTDDMVSYVANCQSLADEFRCCVVPVHHRPKDSESRDPRGHSSLRGGMDTVILVEAGQTKRAEVVKQKDGADGARFLFNLHVVELGQDEDGDPVTSCVVEHTDRDLTPSADPFSQAVAKLSQNNRLIFDQLGELLETIGEGVPDAIPEGEINRMKVAKIASLDAWRDKSISATGTGAGHSRDAGKKAFNRALPALRNAGVVRVWEDWAWITHELPGT